MAEKILVCDDDRDIVRAISVFLKSEGYEPVEAYNGKEALEVLEREDISLCLLDVMMPEMDGLKALEELRKDHNIPVILLTAKSEDTDKILGLNIGADDYVTKPFAPLELMARVRSQLRRYTRLGGNVSTPDILKCGGIELSDNSKEVCVDGEQVHLTKTEYDILKLLMENPGKVFTPSEIYRSVWNEDGFGSESTVAVHVRHLREKIEINPSEPRFIKMIWGQGYYLEKVRG